jgi:hypothetical protein
VSLASRSALDRLRIIILGYFVRGPMGGIAWHHLQYVMGLYDLGHDVYFVEDSDDIPWCCYNPTTGKTDTDPTYGLQFAASTFQRVGLGDRWTYHDAHTSRWFGPGADHILDICAGADLLLNLSCANPLRPWLMEIPVRTLIDTDPVFTQIRNLTDPVRRHRSSRHTTFLSFGENIGLRRSAIPADGLPWQATRQPIVLDAWPVTLGPTKGKFTTVMQWDSYSAREHHGRRYGMKSDSFGPYLDLPERAGPVFELAVGSASAPRPLLRSKGWAVRDALEPTRDPWTYQLYIQQSKAEFSVAKHGYVISRSGWFSERSAAYLASGRPVLIQDTGFSDWLPTGAGVIPFSTPEEAQAGIEEINSRYEFHCRAARAIAEEYFDAGKVLPRLIQCAMSCARISEVLSGKGDACESSSQ